MRLIKSIICPQTCVVCRQACETVSQFPGFCRKCLCQLPLIPYAGTGFFWPYQLSHSIVSEERIYGAAYYEEPLRSCLIRLKFMEQIEIASAVAPIMLRTILKVKQPCDALIAVPLHDKRLKQRGYNQAALIVQSICRISGYLDASDSLVRVRSTRRQSEIESRAERYSNMRQAFDFRDDVWQNHEYPSIRPGIIWLVDDVVTTGATLQEAARPLRMAGFKVNALVLAVNSGGLSLKREILSPDEAFN